MTDQPAGTDIVQVLEHYSSLVQTQQKAYADLVAKHEDTEHALRKEEALSAPVKWQGEKYGGIPVFQATQGRLESVLKCRTSHILIRLAELGVLWCGKKGEYGVMADWKKYLFVTPVTWVRGNKTITKIPDTGTVRVYTELIAEFADRVEVLVRGPGEGSTGPGK